MKFHLVPVNGLVRKGGTTWLKYQRERHCNVVIIGANHPANLGSCGLIEDSDGSYEFIGVLGVTEATTTVTTIKIGV